MIKLSAIVTIASILMFTQGWLGIDHVFAESPGKTGPICKMVDKSRLFEGLGSGDQMVCLAKSLQQLSPENKTENLVPGDYCAVCASPQPGRVECRDCRSPIFGGEGGRVWCGVRNSDCSIHFGSCGDNRDSCR